MSLQILFSEEEEEEDLWAGLRQSFEAVCSHSVSCSQGSPGPDLYTTAPGASEEEVQIFGWVMEPSPRCRFSICVLLICAQVVTLFGQEDRDTGESQMLQLMCEEAEGWKRPDLLLTSPSAFVCLFSPQRDQGDA